jgi:hypothetical protein
MLHHPRYFENRTSSRTETALFPLPMRSHSERYTSGGLGTYPAGRRDEPKTELPYEPKTPFVFNKKAGNQSQCHTAARRVSGPHQAATSGPTRWSAQGCYTSVTPSSPSSDSRFCRLPRRPTLACAGKECRHGTRGHAPRGCDTAKGQSSHHPPQLAQDNAICYYLYFACTP